MTTPTTLLPIFKEALVRNALMNYHKTNNYNTLEVTRCDFKLSSVTGENFCSDVFAVDVKYQLDGNDMEKSFIVKIMKPEIAEAGSSEEHMFTTVLPGMEECLASVNGIQFENKLHARCFVSERKDMQEFYVLENLNTLGYFSADRIKGLDADHCRLLMQKTGKFHAASMLYAEKFPDDIKNLGECHFANGASDFVAKSITFGGLAYVADMIENWEGYESLALKVRSIIPRFNDMVKQVVNPQNATFNVITHGDLWVNNILYKYDHESKKPTDVLFVDFQNSFWGSCGYDLNWFLYTSLELDVLKEHRMDLLQSYYDSLRSNLEINKFPAKNIPSWEDVLSEVKRTELIGLYTCLCELPIVALDRAISKDFTLDTYAQPEEMMKMRVAMYASERIKEYLLYTLKYFEEIELL